MRLAFCLLVCLATPAVLLPGGIEDFRVELYSKTGVREVRLTADRAPVRLSEGSVEKTHSLLNPGDKTRCAAVENGIRCQVGDQAWTFTRLSAASDLGFLLEAVPNRAAKEEGARSIRARAAAVSLAGGHLRVLATLDLETYVQGVLAGEAATLKSPPALAAMAVVARTWALRSRGRHRAEGFDFCSLTHCQVFRPPPDAAKAPSPFERAVQDTAASVLKYRDELIDAYYSANCGGVTAAARDVWPDRGQPYLASVRDPYCARDERTSWTRVITMKDLSLALGGERGVPPEDSLHDVVVETRDSSGRARTLRLLGDRTQRTDASQFRSVVNRKLGWNTLKSTLFTIERQGDTVAFHGRGLGHGVGFCQTGADQMGQMGFGYEKILAHYFQGTKVAKAEPAHAAQVLSSERFDLFFPPREAPQVPKALQILETERRRLGARAEALPPRITVRTWETTEKFIRATGQPGWVSASNDGRVIDLQSLTTLQAKGILASTLRHELTHLVVRRWRATGVPSWYEEGMVLYLTGERVGNGSNGLEPATSAGQGFAKSKSQIDAERAYERARMHVADLARRRGEPALWQVLQQPAPEDIEWFKDRR